MTTCWISLIDSWDELSLRDHGPCRLCWGEFRERCGFSGSIIGKPTVLPSYIRKSQSLRSASPWLSHPTHNTSLWSPDVWQFLPQQAIPWDTSWVLFSPDTVYRGWQQIPQVKGSLLQDWPPPPSHTSHKSRLSTVLLTTSLWGDSNNSYLGYDEFARAAHKTEVNIYFTY